MQSIDKLEHIKRFLIDVIVELTKVKSELLETFVELTKTKEQLHRANILIRQLAIPTPPPFSTLSHPHPLAPPLLVSLSSNFNPVSYSSMIPNLNLCYNSFISTYCRRIQEITEFNSKAAAPTEEDISVNTLFFTNIITYSTSHNTFHLTHQNTNNYDAATTPTTCHSIQC